MGLKLTDQVSLGISIIICCFNSSKRIVKTLKHLAGQSVSPNILWEIILVDNASIDDTAILAKKTWDNYNTLIPLVIVSEPTPGLSFAREKGIDEAQYEYLLFCDDDNWLNPNFIQTVFDIMQTNEKIGALGGYGIPEFEIQPDHWIKNYQGIYATGKQGETNGENTSKAVYGAACTYRKAALHQLFSNGFRHYLTGRQGNKLTAGEDHEICYALALINYEIWYDDRLKFKHFIPKERISYDYLKKNIYSFSRCSFYTNIYKIILKNGNHANFKTSWLWVLLNKIRFLGKDCLVLVKNLKRKDPFSFTLFKVSINSTLFLALNKRKFKAVTMGILSSCWIKNIQE